MEFIFMNFTDMDLTVKDFQILCKVPIAKPSTALAATSKALELDVTDYKCNSTSQEHLMHRMLENTSVCTPKVWKSPIYNKNKLRDYH